MSAEPLSESSRILQQHFSPAYEAQLRTLADTEDDFRAMHAPSGEALLAQLAERRYAASSSQPGEAIPYVRLGAPSDQQCPILFVPGFTEGIEAKASFALELARRGAEVILPGQNRRKIIKDGLSNKKDATCSQAQNYLDVLRAENLADTHGSVDIAAHSYGGLIFERMYKQAQRQDLPCFSGVAACLLASSGLNENERMRSLGTRFIRGVVTESFMGLQKDFPDVDNVTMKAAMANAVANVLRTVREAYELATRRIDYTQLLHSTIGRIIIMSYAEDDVFPAHTAAQTMERIFDYDTARRLRAGGNDTGTEIVWTTPLSLQPLNGNENRLRAGNGASHNDEQFNPSRVAGAVMRALHSNI